MSEVTKGKVAIIGDPDILLIFKFLGLSLFPVQTENEAREALKEVEARNFKLCLLQQNFYFLIAEREKRKEKWPVFLPFRDYRQSEDLLQEGIKKMMIKATGSDTLLRKGQKEG
ncbi:MAG: hypothetical protein N3B16_06370 [Candidatus Aminicenantes bacterium]|nr:hypothetical protein [Candidatus Aminicenantes bacterium]